MCIPITVGISGHRNLCKDDIPALCDIVRTELNNLKAQCPHSPIVMLNSLAEGADQLCAKIALEMEIPVVVPLPMQIEEYHKDFSGEARVEFDRLCAKAAEVFVAPYTEAENHVITRDYYYRQAGIYVANHCHVLLALWNGSPAMPNGCGTAEAVDFMLNVAYQVKQGSFFKAASDGAVIQIVTPRTGTCSPDDALSVRLIENTKGALYRSIQETDSFNHDVIRYPKTKSYPLIDNETLKNTRERAKTLHKLYEKADGLSLLFRDKYMKIMKWLSVFGVALVFAFLLYDEMESDLFLIVYGIILVLSGICFVIAKKGSYHKKYLEYRTLAETLRVQFYLDVSDVDYNICDRYTWSQKNEIVWIKEAVSALIAGGTVNKNVVDHKKVKTAWIDIQLDYHVKKLVKMKKSDRLNSGITKAILMLSILIFIAVFIMEFFFSKAMTTVFLMGNLRQLFLMHEGQDQDIILRGVLKILLGVLSAITLFLANYYGKLSLNRKISDHEKMIALYSAAQKKFDDERIPKKLLFLELAQEEIMENGNWISYSRDNAPSINL